MAAKLPPAQTEVLRAVASPKHRVWQGTIDRRWYLTDLDGANAKVVTASVNALRKREILARDATYRAVLTEAGREALAAINHQES
jgi:hypothetical protein